MSRSLIENQKVGIAICAGCIATILLVYAFKKGNPTSTSKKLNEDVVDRAKEGSNNNDSGNKSRSSTPIRSASEKSNAEEETATPKTTNINNIPQEIDDKVDSKKKKIKNELAALLVQIEEIDKRGKKLFKSKSYMDAAIVFTEALTLIDTNMNLQDSESTGSLDRQVVTLTNNRSAMYEKADMADLALHDCDTILELDLSHTKARVRKLRILESQSRYKEALLEVCAIQLLFMQGNRDKLRLGIPVAPPVSQSKIEELMGHILPGEIDFQLDKIKTDSINGGGKSFLPSKHTIVSLLQSFSGYNSWMGSAARDGSLEILTSSIDSLEGEVNAERVNLLLKRGRRYAYHRNFEKCATDFEEALKILDDDESIKKNLDGDDTYARILEWAGICNHLKNDLENALNCYEKCSVLEPNNPEIIVKRAGVKMDAGKYDEALTLFDKALALDPAAVDALHHRANLHMLKEKPKEAKEDLLLCLQLCPDHVSAHLRLATLFMATQDLPNAKKHIDLAENLDPESSEVHSYRGEMYFSEGNLEEARNAFDTAVECDSTNAAPLVNSALAIMNTPGKGGGPPEFLEAISMLEKAVIVEPQFLQAYVHLGQLKLSMATDLTIAKEVIALYDKGMTYCKGADDFREILSMRILAIAQVEGASMLKMETLNMQ